MLDLMLDVVGDSACFRNPDEVPPPRSGPGRDANTFCDRWTRKEGSERPRDMWEIGDPHQIAGLIESDQVAHPGEGGHVGDGIGVAHDPATVCEPLVEYAEQAPRFRHVAVA